MKLLDNILKKLYDKKQYIICIIAILVLFIIIYLWINQDNSNTNKFLDMKERFESVTQTFTADGTWTIPPDIIPNTPITFTVISCSPNSRCSKLLRIGSCQHTSGLVSTKWISSFCAKW